MEASLSSGSSRWVVWGALTLNLANSTLGAGVLGLPFVALEAGLLAAVLMIAGCGVLTDWTLFLLMRCQRMTGLATFEAIGERCFGRKGRLGVATGVLLINLGAQIAYLVIAADLVAPLLPLHRAWTARAAVVLVCATLAFPLCLVRGRLLAFVSLLSVALVVLFVAMVAAQAASGTVSPSAGPLRLVNWSSQLVFVFGIAVFAYGCHTNLVPLLAAESPNSDLSLQPMGLHAAMVLCSVLYLVGATCGYSYLRDLTPPNYLFFFPQSDVAIAVFRCFLAASLLFTLPLCVMPNVVAITQLTGYDFPKIYSAVLLLLTTLVALFVPNVAIVFSLTGSLASSLTSFIFPPLCYAHLSGYSFKSLRALPFLVCACFGVCVAIVGLVSAVIDIANS